MNWSRGGLGLDVPDPVVTLTSTVPSGSGGAVAVIEVALFTVKVDAAHGPELHRGDPGEVGPGDGDRGAPGGRARGRAHGGDGGAAV